MLFYPFLREAFKGDLQIMSATEQGFSESDKHMPTTLPICFSITEFQGSWQKGNVLENTSVQQDTSSEKQNCFCKSGFINFNNTLIGNKRKFGLEHLEKSSWQVILIHFFLLLHCFIDSSHSLMAFWSQFRPLWLIIISSFIPVISEALWK